MKYLHIAWRKLCRHKTVPPHVYDVCMHRANGLRATQMYDGLVGESERRANDARENKRREIKESKFKTLMDCKYTLKWNECE